jgi:hypothetical protein
MIHKIKKIQKRNKMPLETKRFQISLHFFNQIINSGMLELIDFTNKEEQVFIKKENEEFEWGIRKSETEDNGFYEIKIDFNNVKFLRKNLNSINRKEYNKRKLTYNCFIYDKNVKYSESSYCPSVLLLKNKYDKKKIEFIHNDFWFKEFKVKNCSTFIFWDKNAITIPYNE